MDLVHGLLLRAPAGVERWPDWPLYGLESNLVPAAEDGIRRGDAMALATLVRVDGSSPRRVGSEMLITSAGSAHGYVSGGCVEAAVASEALECLRDGRPRTLHYGQGSPFFDIQLTCGGSIYVFVRRLEDPAWWVRQIRLAQDRRCPTFVVTDLTDGTMWQASTHVRSTNVTFVKRYDPQTRLVLVGSDPVTMATAILAGTIGIETLLWRPNGPPDPPCGVSLAGYFTHPAAEGLGPISLDRFTALYCLTHDMHLDVAILRAALDSDSFCVGVLGSRLKHTLRAQRLAEVGLQAEQVARLRSPAGLQIGADDPFGIGLSILAEVVAARNERSGDRTPYCGNRLVV
jgi:Xanthine and CO dehydrogenases maturation factor, XdhC/CoxF family